MTLNLGKSEYPLVERRMNGNLVSYNLSFVYGFALAKPCWLFHVVSIYTKGLRLLLLRQPFSTCQRAICLRLFTAKGAQNLNQSFQTGKLFTDPFWRAKKPKTLGF